MTFNFVNDEQIKEMLIRDYTELETCLNNRASKSVLILSGSILEAVLIDFFSSKTTEDSEIKKLYTESLGSLIDRAKNEKLIDDKHKNFSSGIQGYRNLIHPGREVRLKEKFDFDTASLSFSALKLILREIELKSLSEKGRSANEIFNKLTQEGLPASLFVMITDKLNKTERHKLFLQLIDDDLGNNGPRLIIGANRYAEMLSDSIDKSTFQNLAGRLMREIELGSKSKAIKYIKYFHHILSDLYTGKDKDIVNELIINEVNSKLSDKDDMRYLSDSKLFEALFWGDKNFSKSENLLYIAQHLSYFYSKDKFPVVYLDVWTTIHSLMDEDAYKKLNDQLADSPVFTKFIELYDNGDYLPF